MCPPSHTSSLRYLSVTCNGTCTCPAILPVRFGARLCYLTCTCPAKLFVRLYSRTSELSVRLGRRPCYGIRTCFAELPGTCMCSAKGHDQARAPVSVSVLCIPRRWTWITGIKLLSNLAKAEIHLGLTLYECHGKDRDGGAATTIRWLPDRRGRSAAPYGLIQARTPQDLAAADRLCSGRPCM